MKAVVWNGRSRARVLGSAGGGAILMAAAMLVGPLLIGCTQDVSMLRTRAIRQFRNGQYVESTATLREVLEIARSDAKANYYMGLNYRAIAARKFRDGNIPAACREVDTAILYFKQALKSWPNYMAAADAKNEAFEARGKYDEALKVAQRVASNNRGIAEHFVVLGDEYMERGDYDNALRSYKLALSSAPRYAPAYHAMGRLYRQVGDEASAADAYQRAAELTGAGQPVTEPLASSNTGYEAYPAPAPAAGQDDPAGDAAPVP